MTQVLHIFSKAVNNKVLKYIFSRYLTYFIQFINSLFIAIYLGPYYLGVWGFINLIIQYFAQINFGIGHSANAIASIHKQKEGYVKMIIGTSISMFIILSAIVIFLFTANDALNFKFGEKYNFSQYAPLVLIPIIMGYFIGLLSVTYRIYGKIYKIAFSQTVFPVITLITLFFFRGSNLLWALILGLCFSTITSIILFLINPPIKVKPIFNWRLVKIIQNKGWFLFIYNTSFYLIILSTRSFVSAFYSVEEFGYFTFAFTLANAILLLLESLSFLIYPKLLNRFASATNERASNLLGLVRDMYITTSHLLIHIAIFIFPLFLSFLPKYEQASNAFNIISLTVVLYTNSFGYSGLLIAKGEEKRLGQYSIIALCINIIIAFLLVQIYHVHYSYVIFSTMFTYFFYVILIGTLGARRLKIKSDFISVLKDILPIRLLTPYFTSVILTLFSAHYEYFIIPLILFITLNYKQLCTIKSTSKQIIINPNLINI